MNDLNFDSVPAAPADIVADKEPKSKKDKKGRTLTQENTTVNDKHSKEGKTKDNKKDKKEKSSQSTSANTPLPSASQASKSTTSIVPLLSASTSNFQPSKSVKLLVQPTPDWYAVLPPLPASSKPIPAPTSSQITSLTDRASKLLADEMAQYSSAPHASLVSSSSDQAFLKNILASGTLSDRLSALTLMVQSSPLHNMRGLEVLKGMAEKGRGGGGPSKEGGKGKGGGREERLKAARAIVDWWVGGGAPDRKLK